MSKRLEVIMFEILFWFGVAFVVSSVILGQTVSSNCCYTPTSVFSMTYLFQPLPILLFITFTGGSGMIISHLLVDSNLFLIWILALWSGALFSYSLTRWVFTPILSLENTSSTSNLSMYGKSFVLSRDIKYGKIVSHPISIGSTYQDRVISLHKSSTDFLEKGTKVYILAIKDNVLFIGDKI